MAEIPYFFETPVPRYFRENGWFECEHMFKFIHWAFSKCQTIPHKRVLEGREITLAPFEFIAGRLSSPKECFLTENIFRNQRLKLEKAGLLKKSTNSLTNHFSCYVWVTEAFCKNDNQQNNQPSTNRQPTVNHKDRYKKKKDKEDHHPLPSSFENLESGDEDLGLMIDDFSLNLEKQTKTEIHPGIFLTQQDLEACIKIKGSMEKVKDSIEAIQSDKKRKYDIHDWPSTLANWKIPNKTKPRIEENLTLAEKICRKYSDFNKSSGYRCRLYLDRNRDQKCLLFEHESPHVPGSTVPLVEADFRDRCYELLVKYQMLTEKV